MASRKREKDVDKRWPQPVVYRRSSERVRRLSARQVDGFQRRGYLVLRRFSSAAELALLRSIFARSFARRRQEKLGILGQFDRDGRTHTEKVVNPQLEFPALLGAKHFEKMQHYAAQVLGDPEAGIESILMFLNKYGRGGATPWHQDMNSKPAHVAEQVTFWMPLERVDAENGCLTVIPGSHLGPCFPHESCMIDDRLVDPRRVKTCPIGPGDCVLIHGRVVHGATANRTRRARRVFFVYCLRTS